MMWIIRNTVFWSKIFILWTLALLIFNVIPNFTPESLQMEETSPIRTDYIQHFLSFLVLSLLYFLSGKKTFLNRIFQSNWLILVAGITFAALVEGLQFYIPGRSFNPVDMILNVAGLLSGILPGIMLKKYFPD